MRRRQGIGLDETTARVLLDGPSGAIGADTAIALWRQHEAVLRRLAVQWDIAPRWPLSQKFQQARGMGHYAEFVASLRGAV
jgi:hypothetical protein